MRRGPGRVRHHTEVWGGHRQPVGRGARVLLFDAPGIALARPVPHDVAAIYLLT